MLYVASLPSQPPRADANGAPRPDDAFERFPVPVTDGARYVVRLGKVKTQET
jgi:hypothetical protein